MKVFTAKALSAKLKQSSTRNNKKWWSELSRKEQTKYLESHKRSRKNRTVSTQASKADTNKTRLTSEEMLKNAGLDDNGLLKHSISYRNQDKSTDIDAGKHKAHVDPETSNLPPIPSEHQHWKGFRDEHYGHLEHIAEAHGRIDTSDNQHPRLYMHRAYAGFHDLLQGRQPNQVKRSSAEAHVLKTIQEIRSKSTDSFVHDLQKYDKSLVSMYFGSMKLRYAGKPSPFSDTVHRDLSRFRSNSFTVEPEPIAGQVPGMMKPHRSDHDSYKHVAEFIGSDFIEWLSSQDRDKLMFRLKGHRNGHVKFSDASKVFG